MKKNILLLTIIVLYSHIVLAASLDDLTKKGSDLLKKNINIEIAVKGKKLEEYFSGNTLFLSFEAKKKEFRFQEKKYEVFIDDKITEQGIWKVHGLLKNQIKLTPENKLKPYYLKKINNKPIIYHYDKRPGSESTNKTLLEIIDSNNKIAKKQSTKTNNKKDTKKNSKKKSNKSLLEVGNILNKGVSKVFGTGANDSKDTLKVNNKNTIEKHMLERYRATSDISFFFFEASYNYLQALELLYRAYDNNIEADKINASISYLKESKSSEADRLNSTKSIIGTSTIKLQSSLQDTSYILSEKGRGYYEQSLPFVVGATESTIHLYNSSKGVLQKFSQLGGLSIDSLLSNSNDLVAAATIIPEIPQFSRDLIKTAKLVLNGAKEKKIRNEGKYSKALDQLNLLEFDNEIQDKKKSKVEEPKVEETKVVKKKEEPKLEETKVVKKKEEPKVEETKVVKKKEEPKVEEPKVVKKKEEAKVKEQNVAAKTEGKVPAGKKRIYKYICDPAKSEYYWGKTKDTMKLSSYEDSPYAKYWKSVGGSNETITLWGVNEIDFDEGYEYSSGAMKYDSDDNGTLEHLITAERRKISKHKDNKYISTSEYGLKYPDQDIEEIVTEKIYTENSLTHIGHMKFKFESVDLNYWYKGTRQCIQTEYFVDKNSGEKLIKTYSKTKPLAKKSEEDLFASDVQDAYQAQTNSIFEEVNQQVLNEIGIAEEQYKSVSKNINKNKSLQDESQKFINEVSKEQLKEYKATSMITYFFFESQANYLASLELLYRAYDKNIEADKMKAQISYLKDSKSSENKRLKSTTQIINQASEVLIKDINNKDIKLSEESKLFYQKSLPFAFKATDYGYKVFVVSSAVGKNISNSSDKVGSILVNFNEVIGFATIVPRIPSYVKTVGSTAKLIFSGAKTKKIKDKENLSAALDELDLSA